MSTWLAVTTIDAIWASLAAWANAAAGTSSEPAQDNAETLHVTLL